MCIRDRLLLLLVVVVVKFFRAFNAILARTGGRSSDIFILHLTRSFCFPVFLYGLESVSDNNVLRSVQFCWSKILLRVFKVSSVDTSALVCYYAGILPPAFVVDLRKLRYYSKPYSLHLDSPNANITWYCMHASNVTLYGCCSYHIRCISMFLIRR